MTEDESVLVGLSAAHFLDTSVLKVSLSDNSLAIVQSLPVHFSPREHDVEVMTNQ